jgi:hypothetical protein
VSPSEIAAYAYCGRAYWLERVRRVEGDVGREGRLDAGTRAHRAHNVRVVVARALYRIALIAAAVTAGLILWWLARRTGIALR